MASVSSSSSTRRRKRRSSACTQDFPGTSLVCVFDTRVRDRCGGGHADHARARRQRFARPRSLMLFQHAAQGDPGETSPRHALRRADRAGRDALLALGADARGRFRSSSMTRNIPFPDIGDGWRELILPEARAGARYAYRVDKSLLVPDPASRFQPDDVQGRSLVVDPTRLHMGGYAVARAAFRGSRHLRGPCRHGNAPRKLCGFGARSSTSLRTSSA